MKSIARYFQTIDGGIHFAIYPPRVRRQDGYNVYSAEDKIDLFLSHSSRKFEGNFARLIDAKACVEHEIKKLNHS